MKKHTIPFTSEWREWINGFYIAALIVYVLYVIFKIVAMDLDAEEWWDPPVKWIFTNLYISYTDTSSS